MPRKVGGAKKADVQRAATYMEMINIARRLFSITDTDCYLGNYNGTPMSTNLTCEVFVKSTIFVTLPRLYIVTEVPNILSSDDDSTVDRISLSPPCLTPQKLHDLNVTPQNQSDIITMAPKPNNSQGNKLETNNNEVVLVQETDISDVPEDSYVITEQVS